MSSAKLARLIPQPQDQQSDEILHMSSFAVIKQGDKILLEKRIRPEFTANKWTMPSAIIYFGEDPETAIKRIIKEQLGVEPKSVRLIDVQSYGDKHWDMCFVYDVSIENVGQLSPDIEKVEYFHKSEFPLEFRTDHREVLLTLGP